MRSFGLATDIRSLIWLVALLYYDVERLMETFMPLLGFVVAATVPRSKQSAGANLLGRGWRGLAVYRRIAPWLSHNQVQAVAAGLLDFLCLPNGVVWTPFGTVISRLPSNDVRRVRLNSSMAMLLVVPVSPSLF